MVATGKGDMLAAVARASRMVVVWDGGHTVPGRGARRICLPSFHNNVCQRDVPHQLVLRLFGTHARASHRAPHVAQ